MSLSKVSLRSKNPFFISKTRPRKALSHSPFKLFGDSVSHELGPYYQTIDLRIGNQRMKLDTTQGCWTLGDFQTNSSTFMLFFLLFFLEGHDEIELKKRKCVLAEENKTLRVKLNILLEMLAEVTAEETLQAILNSS